MADMRERFGILIRPTGRFEIVQLGFDGGDETIINAVKAYFGGDVDWSRTNDEYAYFSVSDAIGRGLTRNDAAAWFANMPQYGDVILLPKKRGNDKYKVNCLRRSDAYRRSVWMRTLWERECDYRANPEKYSFNKKRNAARA